MWPPTKICDGPSGWWFDGDWFYDDPLCTKPIANCSDGSRRLRVLLCERVFSLYRWAGEEGPYGCFSVGAHCQLVAYLARRLAEERDLDDATQALAMRFGAVHDLGERLGLGDPARPIVRSFSTLSAIAERHQAAAARLFFGASLPSAMSRGAWAAAQIVHDADSVACLIERRALYADHSGDVEGDLDRVAEIASELGVSEPAVTGPWSLHRAERIRLSDDATVELHYDPTVLADLISGARHG